MRSDTAATCNPAALLSQRNHLEGARAHYGVGIGAEIDDRALASEDGGRGRCRGRGAGHTGSTVDEDVLRVGIDRRCHIERGAEGRVAGRTVVRFSDTADIEQTERGDRRNDTRGNPGTLSIDRGRAARGRHSGRGPGIDHAAAANEHGAIFDGLASIAGRNRDPGDGDILRAGRMTDECADEAKSDAHGTEGGETLAGLAHFTSPSPGWPSSKSLTGRRLRSMASYISAPSIQTFSGLV